jgi:acyl-CoA thioester hydrolase
VPVDFALNRPRRLTPEEKTFLDKYLDDAPA